MAMMSRILPPRLLHNPLTLNRIITRSIHYQSQPILPLKNATSSNLDWYKLSLAGGLIACTAGATHLFLNRSKRSGQMHPFDKSYLNSSFIWLGGGLSVVAASAYTLKQTGLAYKLLNMSPWAIIGVGLIGGIGGSMGVSYTHPNDKLAKLSCWTLFNISQAVLLTPLVTFVSPAILYRAAFYTSGLMASIAYVGATASTDQYLYLGGPLLVGVTVVALSGLAPVLLPRYITGKSLTVLENISLYGGLVVFSGFTLWDTQKILAHARLIRSGMMLPDPIKEAVSLELDFINIFVRIVQILTMQQRKR